MIEHFRGRWPEQVVPEGEPTWLLFEVEVNEDRVLRTVDVFEDGSMQRNSIALEERDGYPCLSIVEGPFMPLVRKVALEKVPAALFEGLWNDAEDRPRP